jgi:hypothetical protein
MVRHLLRADNWLVIFQFDDLCQVSPRLRLFFFIVGLALRVAKVTVVVALRVLFRFSLANN